MNTQEKQNQKIIKQLQKQIFLHFSILGDYDDFDSWHDTLGKAEKELKDLIENRKEDISRHGYFAFIAKPVKVVRVVPDD